MSDSQLIQQYHLFPPELKIAVSSYIEFLAQNYADVLNATVSKKTVRKFGIGKGIVKYMAPDFDEPLDDLSDKMF